MFKLIPDPSVILKLHLISGVSVLVIVIVIFIVILAKSICSKNKNNNDVDVAAATNRELKISQVLNDYND